MSNSVKWSYAKIHEKRDNKKHEASLIIAMSVLKAIGRNCDIWPKEIYPVYVTILDHFQFIPLAKLWGKKTTGTQHLRYAFSTNKQTQIQQTYKNSKHTNTKNIHIQQTDKDNKHTNTTNIQTQQTNIQIQQQQKLKDNKYTNPTSIQIQKKLIQQTHKSNKHTKTTNTALWESWKRGSK